jgi:hypothetical protein
MQSAALFPPTLLTLLSNGQLYEHMLLEVLAGMSTYLLLRRLSVSRWASVGAGVAFALNGAFGWFSHAPVNPLPFLPMLLLGIELAYEATVARRPGGWWLIAVAGALSVYAGFFEVAYIDTLMAIFWFAWRCGCVTRDRLRAFAGKTAAGAIVGTLLAAPMVIMSIDYITIGDLGLNGTGYLGSAHLATQALPQLLLPYVYGPILGFTDPKLVAYGIWVNVGGYLSTSLLVLGLLGTLSKGRRGLKVALLAWIVLAAARMYGGPGPLNEVLGVLPGMSRVAFFRYAPASVSLAIIVLAAVGIDELVRLPRLSRRALWVLVASLALIVGAAIGARSLADQLGSTFSHRPYYVAAVAWGMLIAVAAVAPTLLRDHRRRALVAALVVAADAVALFAVPELSAPRAVQTDLAPVAFLRAHLGSSRFYTLGPLQPNYGSYFGIASLNINDLPIPTRFERYVRGHLDQVVDPTVLVGNYGGGRPLFAPSPQQELLRNIAGYRAAGVAYVLTPAGQPLPQSQATFRLVFRSPSTWIYHLAGSAPYFDATNPRCRVAPQSGTSVRLTCPGPTVLMRRETSLPGWSASLDGHSTRVAQAGDLFQAVAVGAGAHRVQFSYVPPNLVWGVIAFVVGCGWLLVAISGRRRTCA